jgi:hypothetical protein
MNKARSIWIAAMVAFLLTAVAGAWLVIQPMITVMQFEANTVSDWVVEGDGGAKDGVLVFGGNNKTWARLATDLSPDFELPLEYSTENNKHIQFESHHRHFLGQGSGSCSLDRTSTKPGEWIEAIFWGKADPAGNGWATHSRWRVMGEPMFKEQALGGSGTLPRSSFVAYEIPAGQRLYLRNVRVKTEIVRFFPWLYLLIAGALVLELVIAMAAWVIGRKRAAPPQDDVRPVRATP